MPHHHYQRKTEKYRLSNPIPSGDLPPPIIIQRYWILRSLIGCTGLYPGFRIANTLPILASFEPCTISRESFFALIISLFRFVRVILYLHSQLHIFLKYSHFIMSTLDLKHLLRKETSGLKLPLDSIERGLVYQTPLNKEYCCSID